jgi:hypothetical protein
VHESLAVKFAALFPHLDERQRRLAPAAEARVLGHGGIKVVAAAAGMQPGTVSKGWPSWRRAGAAGRGTPPAGGRKRLAHLDPGLRHEEERASREVQERRPGMAGGVSRPGSAPTTSLTTRRTRRSRAASATWPPMPAEVNVGTDHDAAAFAVESIRRLELHLPCPQFGRLPGL